MESLQKINCGADFGVSYSILIIIKNRRAVGVEVDYNGQRLKVRAKQEVIVSNGALRTPQLLMLSGIGPKEELEKFNINVVADLPVGKNLMDHSAAILLYQLSDKILPITVNALNPINLLNYAVNRKGVFASAQVPLLAFLDGLNNTSDFPRQQLYFVEYATVDSLLNCNLKDGVYDKYYSPHSLKPLYACISSLLQPKSRGTITLRSRDPYDYPRIDPNYYHHPDDLRDVVEGMKICQAMSKHPALQQLEARLIDTDILFPGCERFAKNEDRYFACLARNVITIFWHFTGTARMGRRGDPRSVVDPELRVIGVKNLRVVNAAVMPIVPSGNINVPTMMVAEKAYDMMKGDIQCEGAHKK